MSTCNRCSGSGTVYIKYMDKVWCEECARTGRDLNSEFACMPCTFCNGTRKVWRRVKKLAPCNICKGSGRINDPVPDIGPSFWDKQKNYDYNYNDPQIGPIN